MSDLKDVVKIIEGLGYLRAQMEAKNDEIERLTACCVELDKANAALHRQLKEATDTQKEEGEK